MSAKAKLKERGELERLLPLLQEAQAKFGSITPEAILQLAASLNIPTHDVYAVASFYSFLSLKPSGRHVIRICRSLPCHLKNSEAVSEIIAREIGIAPGQTTSDGKFSLEYTNCIGLCDESPAMLIDNDPHTLLTSQKIRKILEAYK